MAIKPDGFQRSIKNSGYIFILTVVEDSTRYPEVKALKLIDTETVAEALGEIFSRVGKPREVLTDHSKRFTFIFKVRSESPRIRTKP